MQEKRGMNHSFHGYNLQHSNNCFKYSGYEYTPELCHQNNGHIPQFQVVVHPYSSTGYWKYCKSFAILCRLDSLPPVYSIKSKDPKSFFANSTSFTLAKYCLQLPSSVNIKHKLKINLANIGYCGRLHRNFSYTQIQGV